MNQREYDGEVRNGLYRFIVKPLIFIIGIIIISEIINAFIFNNNLFRNILTTGGILSFLIFYFKNEFNK